MASVGLGDGQAHGVNDAGSARDGRAAGSVSSSPLLVFPTPPLARTSAFGVEEGSHGSGDLSGAAGGGFRGSSRGVVTLRGRGVIKAARAGRALLLDTHPSDAPPSPSPSPSPPPPLQPPAMPPPRPPCVQERILPPHSKIEIFSVSAVQGRRYEDSRGRCAGGSSPVSAECTPGKPATGDGRLPPPHADGQGSTGGPAAAENFTRNFSDAPDAPEATKGKRKYQMPGPVRGAVLGPAVAVAALPTLGEMCKRGVLVRASRRITCISVVGVKFAKAATWCRNCGMVSGKRCYCEWVHQPFDENFK